MDFRFFVNHRVEGHGFPVFLATALGLAEIDAARKFANAEHIEAVRNQLVFDGRSMNQRGQADSGTEIGEKAEVLAQRQQRAAFRLDIRRQIFPLGTTHRPEKDRIRLFAGADGFRGQGMPGGIDRGSTDLMFAAVYDKTGFFGDGIQHAQRLGHDFGADAVAG